MSFADRLHLVALGELKDPSGLHAADPDRFRERFSAALASAVPWSQIAEGRRTEAAGQEYERAKPLLHDPNLMERVRQAIKGGGYAGDLIPALIIFLAAVSRLLPRPMNVAVVAQSASGKNRTVRAALELIPPEAIYSIDAGSERSLIYTDEPFEHRILVVGEADSLPEDGPAASAVRSIAEDNCMSYDTVERDEKTGRHVSRRIEKAGPTCLLTTSTRSVRDQMGTRVLELPLRDDAAQTREVLRAEAREFALDRPSPVDLTPFHALQRYLEATGPHAVVINFAPALSELVPANTVRMRRDYRKIMAAIQAHAILHCCQRERTAHGEIVATFADYVPVRELLAPVFDASMAEGVTQVIRDTVEKVPEDREVSETELASLLSVNRSTVSYRVQRAIKGGWLVNNEIRKGHPAKIARGAPLPERCSALPTAEQLQEYLEQVSNCPTRLGGDAPPPLPLPVAHPPLDGAHAPGMGNGSASLDLSNGKPCPKCQQLTVVRLKSGPFRCGNDTCDYFAAYLAA